MTKPARREREFTFGSTHCYVAIRATTPPAPGATAIADVFIVEEGGQALRRVANTRGVPRTFDADDAVEALALAALYLERQFGPLRDAAIPVPEHRPARPVRDPPLRRTD